MNNNLKIVGFIMDQTNEKGQQLVGCHHFRLEELFYHIQNQME